MHEKQNINILGRKTMRFTSGRQKEHCLENQEVCIGIVLVMELINILLDVGGDLFKFCVYAFNMYNINIVINLCFSATLSSANAK